jgi:hypothetical protein
MSKRTKTASTGTMLDLWRPPEGAGDPIGCLATTYTFTPGLFDEQCLARFLEIESEPNREDLAFLLERETRLGSVYAGVLVDHTQAGVEHSLRWDVLPVRVRTGKQHAKLSLLVWTRHIRIIVASANLTEPGYRTNFEVASAVDLTPKEAETNLLGEAVGFLRNLLRFVPGASLDLPEILRATAFLDHVERQARSWIPIRRGGGSVRQHLVFTLPAAQQGQGVRNSLEAAIEACRGRGGSPREAWVASPFFDADSDTSRVTASLCKLMARGGRRDVCFCVPEVREETTIVVRRLAAPKALLTTPRTYQGSVTVETLPDVDADGNRRPWHAKMLALFADNYTALMIGSSNFTCAGMGVGPSRNAEANLLTIVDRVAYGREARQLEEVWPDTDPVDDPESAEWLGARPDQEEEEQAPTPQLPAGFLSATYRAGEMRLIALRLDETNLPEDWRVHACGQGKRELLSSAVWHVSGRPAVMELAWEPIQPPEKLLVQWAEYEAFLPLNVEDSRHLPPPGQLEHMSADEMLWILAAPDPSAAFRAWARTQQPPDQFDTSLDSATPIDLDPLRRYDLQATFLHRIRRRARILAQLRSNLQRPVWGRQALEWRLWGLIGIQPVADRLVREFASASSAADEALLTIADFLIVLREVDYQPSEGSLSKGTFEQVFRPFLRDLAARIGQTIAADHSRISKDTMRFWERVMERCRA